MRRQLLISTAVQNGDPGGEPKPQGAPLPRIKHQSSFNDWSKTYINEKGILVRTPKRTRLRAHVRL